MSEVLSGAEAGNESARVVLPPRDERQSLRIARFLMAAGTSPLVCLALAVCAFLGLLPWRAAMEGSAGILALVVVFAALFRSGLNQRFADSSLTTEQVGAAIMLLAYIMYHAGPARAVLTPFYLVAMLFGVLRLSARDCSRASASDLDHFKEINDGFGHAAGDSVLKDFARLVPQELRAVDVHGRFGGEEFLIILPGTDTLGAQACAERVRARTEATAFPGMPRVTVTVGVATYAGKEPVSALLARADKALYDGKSRGRNCVVTIG